MKCEICGKVLPDMEKWSHLAGAHPYGFAATVETIRRAVDSTPGWIEEARRDEAKLLRLAAGLPERREKSKQILREARRVYAEACETALRVVRATATDRGLRETLQVRLDNADSHVRGRFREKCATVLHEQPLFRVEDPYEAERRRQRTNA